MAGKSKDFGRSCVRNPDMEEPAGPIRRSMGKRALMWTGGTGADVAACPSSAGYHGHWVRFARDGPLIPRAVVVVLIASMELAHISSWAGMP